VPFQTPADRADYFQKHGGQYIVATELEYEALADAFMFSPLTPDVRQCYRPQGDRLRYRDASNDLGIVNRNYFLKTFFKPDPAIHGHATNIDYFNHECLRIY